MFARQARLPRLTEPDVPDTLPDVPDVPDVPNVPNVPDTLPDVPDTLPGPASDRLRRRAPHRNRRRGPPVEPAMRGRITDTVIQPSVLF
ncbi:hypothetical protein OG524_34525 [Streptomyces sp. NBC_01520]|uniref:hypothetical protein n=1 Tax=Streptomyces sp. NBC_01520 TaxID=2903892 RepID=UPI003865BD7B